MNWIALAPVPITATFLPVRSTEWSHSAEWKAGPAKVSSPGIFGNDGRESWPTAETSTSNSSVSPVASVTRHFFATSSKSASLTSVPKRTCRRTSYLSATWWR